MSEFIAKVTAELDDRELTSALQNIGKTNITLTNIKPNTSNLISQIQSALNGHTFTIKIGAGSLNTAALNAEVKQIGASAGNTLAQSMTDSLANSRLSSSIAKIERDNLQASYNALKSSNGAKIKDINRAYQEYRLADQRYTAAFKAEVSQRLTASKSADKQQTLSSQAAAKQQLIEAQTAAKQQLIENQTAAKQQILSAQTADKQQLIESQTAAKQQLIEAQTAAKHQLIESQTAAKAQQLIQKQQITSAAKAAKEIAALGSPQGFLTGDFANADNVKNQLKDRYSNGKYGFGGNVMVSAAGGISAAGKEFQKFNIEALRTDGTVQRYTAHVNSLTGELYQLNKGLADGTKLSYKASKNLPAIKESKNLPAIYAQESNHINMSSILDDVYNNAWQDTYGSVYQNSARATLANGGSIAAAAINGLNAVKASKIKVIGDGLTQITSAATKYVSLPVAAATTASVMAFTDYETAFTGVKKTVDGTEAELQAISDGMESMALKIPVASTELANIAKIGGQLGVPTNNLLEFTETFAGLEVATNLQGEEGASTLARFMNVMGEDYGKIENVSSTIVDLGNHTATTESEIAKMATRMGSASSIVGISTADTLGYSAALSALGVEAEMGGSAMTRIWQTIETAVSQGGDELTVFAKKSKMSSKDFAKTWKSSPAEAFNALLKGLSESNDMIGDLGEMGIGNVRDMQALEKLATRYDLVTSSLQRANQAYAENTALQNETDRAYNTTANKLKIAKESIVQASREVGSAIAPTVIDAAKIISNAANNFAALDEDTQKSVTSTALWAAGGIAAVNTAGKMITGIGNMREAIGKLAEITGKSVPSLGKIGLVIGAVTAAVVAGKKAYDAWYKSEYRWSDNFSEQSAQLNEAVDSYTRLTDLRNQYEQAKAVIASPAASTAEIDAAKSKIDEIITLLEKEYNLKITSDTGDLDDAFGTLTKQQRYNVMSEGGQAISDAYDALDGYMESKDKLEEYDTQMSIFQRKAAALSDIRKEAQLLAESGDILDNESYQQFENLKKRAAEAGLSAGNIDIPTPSALVTALNADDEALIGKMQGVVDKYQEVVDQREKFKSSIESSNDSFSSLLANDVQSGNAEDINYSTLKLLEIGQIAQKAGLNTDKLAQSFAAAKTGYTDFAEAISNGKAWDISSNFIQYKKDIGDFAGNEDAVIRQAALIRNGFSEVTPALQQNSDAIKSVIRDMQSLGQEQGINYSAEQLTSMAHAMDLIPDTKHIEFDINTGEVSIIDDLDAKIKSFNKNSDTEIHLKIKEDGSIGIIDTANEKLQGLIEQGADIRITFNTETGNFDLFNGINKIGTVTAEGKIEWADTEPPKAEEPKPTVYPAETEEPEPKPSPDPEPIVYPTETEEPKPEPAPNPEPIVYPTETEEPAPEPAPNPEPIVYPTATEAPSPKPAPTPEPIVYSAVTEDPQPKFATSFIDYGVGETPTTVPNASGTADFGLGQYPTSVPAVPGQANYSGNFPTSAPTIFGQIVYTVKTIGSAIKNTIFGGSDVDGTAHVGGTAFARGTAGTAFKSGTWGTKNSGVALGGELGEELVVRNGKFFTIGSESAEMFAYQKGDIIFNAEQTKQIFEKGKITHGNRRGKAFSTGTAFASGSESAEHFDWIETLDDRTERSISRFTDRFKSAYLTLTNRFVNWGNALSETTKQIDFKQQAYDRYMEQANAVGLDESWAAKVRNGELDISTVTDDDLKEKIKDYEEWFEKALDCKDAIDELHESVAELYTDNFKNIETEYENVLSEIEHRANLLNEYVDRAEEKGLAGSTRYYTALQAAETEKLSQLKREQTDLINALNEAVSSGEIEIYSEAWYELQGSINEVTEAIEESKTALAEFDNQMRQVTWDRFDYMQDSLTQLTDESDFLIDLLSNRELYNTADPEVREIISSMQENSSLWHSASSTEKDTLERQNRNYAKRIANITGKNVEIDDNGVWWIDNQQLYSLNNDNYGGLSDAGMSILGLHGLNYNAYMEQSKAYANELASIDKQLAESPYDTNLIERRRELLKLQRESILAAEDEKQAMIDLVKDGIEQQADALKELIDAYIDSLDSAKDLYDYQKKVKKHTQDIASLEKQLAAYQNDTSEETKSKIQQIKVDLEEAREDLQDTEYDKYISDQKELLNDLYDEYQSLMDERLTDIDVSIDKLIGEVNDSASIISNTLTKETSEVGTALSSEMNSIWTSERQALTTYFGDTGIILNGVSGYFENTNTALTGINGAVNSILAGVNNIVEYASYQAKADIDPEGSKNQMIQNSMDWWATDDESVRNELASENEKYGEALGYTKNDGSWYDSDGNLAYKVTNEDNIRNIVSKMKANSEAWHGASDSKRAELSSANEKYAQKIQSLTDQRVYKDGNGVWWIGDRELYSYKSGGIADFTGAAWLDGTPSKPEMVLNAKDTENFIALKDTLKHMSEQDLSLADIGYRSMDITRLSGLTDISSMLYTLRQTNNSGGGNTIGGIEINIPIDHVDGYNDFITQLQKDKQFERFVRSVSVDLLSGGSSLAKNKYKW